jgi:hypothetical protein
MRFAALFLALLAFSAHASEARLSWTAPTQRTDGTPLTNLAGYRVLWGTAPRTYTRQHVINNPATREWQVTGLTAGTWYFAVTALDATGLESAYSGEASKVVVQAAPPIPPGAIVVGAGPRPVYVITQAAGRLTLVPVGTVPAGTACDPLMAVRDVNGLTAHGVPESAVTWAGSVRRSVVLAECN